MGEARPMVGIIMGGDSDPVIVKAAAGVMEELETPTRLRTHLCTARPAAKLDAKGWRAYLEG